MVIECFDYCIIHKEMELIGYVIMSNHIHMIVQSKEGKLSDLVRDFKKFTASTILQKIKNGPESRKEWMLDQFYDAAQTHDRNQNFHFWRYGHHPKEIYTSRFMWSKLDYIHQNPVRAGIVEIASHYLYSSAIDYHTAKKGLLPLKKFECT